MQAINVCFPSPPTAMTSFMHDPSYSIHSLFVLGYSKYYDFNADQLKRIRVSLSQSKHSFHLFLSVIGSKARIVMDKVTGIGKHWQSDSRMNVLSKEFSNSFNSNPNKLFL